MSFPVDGSCTTVASDAKAAGGGLLSTSVTGASEPYGLTLLRATEERPADRAWFCAIEDYVEFPTPIPSNRNGQYFEQVSHARGWQVGVRLITDSTYDAIVAAANLAALPPVAPTVLPATDTIALTVTEGLLRPRHGQPGRTNGVVNTARRSRRAAAIGYRAEELRTCSA